MADTAVDTTAAAEVTAKVGFIQGFNFFLVVLKRRGKLLPPSILGKKNRPFWLDVGFFFFLFCGRCLTVSAT